MFLLLWLHSHGSCNELFLNELWCAVLRARGLRAAKCKLQVQLTRKLDGKECIKREITFRAEWRCRVGCISHQKLQSHFTENLNRKGMYGPDVLIFLRRDTSLQWKVCTVSLKLYHHISSFQDSFDCAKQ